MWCSLILYGDSNLFKAQLIWGMWHSGGQPNASYSMHPASQTAQENWTICSTMTTHYNAYPTHSLSTHWLWVEDPVIVLLLPVHLCGNMWMWYTATFSPLRSDLTLEGRPNLSTVPKSSLDTVVDFFIKGKQSSWINLGQPSELHTLYFNTNGG